MPEMSFTVSEDFGAVRIVSRMGVTTSLSALLRRFLWVAAESIPLRT